MRAFLFCGVQLMLLPITLIGLAIYGLRLFRCVGAGVSATSFEPLLLRALLHRRGVREDAMALELLRRGPMGGWALSWLVNPTLWAAAVSGYAASVFRFPPVLPSSIRTLVHQRTAFFDEVVGLGVGVGVQLVILGAGWDSRAYGSSLPEGVRVFEVDLPRIQAQKRAVVEAVGVPPGSVRFVPVDLATDSWIDAAQRHGFDPAGETVVIWEGVAYYLEPAAVGRVLGEIGARLPRGLIAFDFPSTALVDARPPLRRLGRSIRVALRWLREPWLCGFEMGGADPGASVAERLGEAGLRIRRFEIFGDAAAPLGGILEAGVEQDPEPTVRR